MEASFYNEYPSVSESKAKPLIYAMEMEEARLRLQSLLLKEHDARSILLDQCLCYLHSDLDICEIISTKTIDTIVVQDEDFVQLNYGQSIRYCLENTTNPFLLESLRFLPKFLMEVSDLYLARVVHNFSNSGYFAELTKTAKTLQRCRQQMISINTGLASFVANRHNTTMLSFDDLQQEGVVGLIKAVDRFDPNRGYQFSTYAIPWIKQAISRLITKQEKIVNLPISLAERASVVFDAMRTVYMQTERWPSVEQLKLLCDLTEDEIKTIRNYYQSTHFLDDESEDDDGLTLMSRMKQQQFPLPLDEMINNNLGQFLDHVIAGLPDKEAQILTMRFGLKNNTEMTLQCIADQLQLSRERVRQIQNIALNKLKSRFGCDLVLFLEPNDSY